MWHPGDGKGHLGESHSDRASRTGIPDALSRQCRAGAVGKYDQLLGEPDAGEQRGVAAGVGRVRDNQCPSGYWRHGGLHPGRERVLSVTVLTWLDFGDFCETEFRLRSI